jgi:uncharacterized protein
MMTNVQVYECCRCEKQSVQKKWVCPSCKNTEFQLKEVKGEGKVFSFTRIHISSQEFAHLTPYTVALIELSNGLRVTGRSSESLEINDEVTCISNEDNTYVFAKK